MAKKKSTPSKSDLRKTILPIGEDVPKAGIPIVPKLNPEEISVSGKRIGIKGEIFHKEDIPIEPKIGPKQILHKVEYKLQPKVEVKIQPGGSKK